LSARRGRWLTLAVDRKLAMLFGLLLVLAAVNAALIRNVLSDQRDVSMVRSLLNQVGGLVQQTVLQSIGMALGAEGDRVHVHAQLRQADRVLSLLRVGGEVDGVVLAPLPSSFQAALRAIQARCDTLDAHVNAVLQEPAKVFTAHEFLPWHQTMMDDVTQLWQANRALVNGLVEQRRAMQQGMLWQMYALLLFDALALFAAYFWMRHTVVQPLHALAMGCRQLAAGDYQVRIMPTAFAEMNEVAQAFNESVERLGVLLTQKEESLWRQANYDELTGLANRYLFRHRLANEISRAQRNHTTIAVLFLDLNLFKDVNDTYGHASGDLVLQQVAKRLAGCVREVDMVARLGGDEFTLIVSEVVERAVVERICANIQTALAAPIDLGDITVQLSCSIGIAFYPQHGASVENLLRYADMAMYQAKRAGAGTTVFYGDVAAQQLD